MTNIDGFLIVLGLAAFWAAILYLANRFLPKYLTRINAGVLWSHMLDASSTFTALTFYGYYEQHVVPTFLIGMSGPWVMFPLKLAVVWGVLYFLDRQKEDAQLKNFLKIIILVLGLALGIRDWLTLGMA
jgi:uncharacterized membrane protein